MTTYAIGDVQGCYDELQRLLNAIGFDQNRDRLWFTGDLVNRGPRSLDTLRFVRSLGDRAITVLGNHDLHLLAVAHGDARLRRKDTLDEILDAPDRDELLDWLRNRPLLHHDSDLGYTVIHAGLPPQWTLADAQQRAQELEAALRGAQHTEFFQRMYGDEPLHWSDGLCGWDRLRFITNCFTRLRYCDPAGRLALAHKGPPGTQPPDLHPWFRIPGRASAGLNIIFGHWSTLGPCADPGIYALDTGCLWGGTLTALALDGTDARTSVPCPGALEP